MYGEPLRAGAREAAANDPERVRKGALCLHVHINVGACRHRGGGSCTALSTTRQLARPAKNAGGRQPALSHELVRRGKLRGAGGVEGLRSGSVFGAQAGLGSAVPDSGHD